VTSPRSARTYAALVRLYPPSFRQHYGNDLVQHFRDLASDRGIRAAWTRSALDLLVTVPRYRLETIMHSRLSSAVLGVTIVLLATAGIVSVVVGLMPGVAFLALAVALASGQRSRLARAIRVPDEDRRRRRFWMATALAIVFLATLVSYAAESRGEEIGDASLLLHNAVGLAAMVGALTFLVLGLATPRSGGRPWLPAGITALAVALAIPAIDGGELSEGWWMVMAVAGVAGIGLVVAAALAAYTATPTGAVRG